MPAIRGGLSHWILPQAKSISPPVAESRSYSAIRGAALRAQPASMPFLSCKFFALQKTYETIVPASMPAIRGAALQAQPASVPFQGSLPAEAPIVLVRYQ
jgi:hypothetical protein